MHPTFALRLTIGPARFARDNPANTAGGGSAEAESSALPEEPADEPSPPPEPAVWRPPQLAPPAGRKRRNAAYHLKASKIARGSYTPQQRILLLDTWQRSGLPAKDFADLVGVSKHTLYKWKGLFEKHGPEGLMDQRRGPQRGSRLSEVTRRAILMLKSAHPEWGCDRISDTLARGPALAASASAGAHGRRAPAVSGGTGPTTVTCRGGTWSPSR